MTEGGGGGNSGGMEDRTQVSKKLAMPPGKWFILSP
jgi:hypothetical protein